METQANLIPSNRVRAFRLFVFLAGAGLFLGLIYQLRTQRANSMRLSALMAEIESLKASNSGVIAPPVASESKPSEEPPIALQERIAQQRAQYVDFTRRIGGQLDSAVKHESVDRDWSSRTVDEIRRLFSSVEGNHLVDADCRVSLCRIVVWHDSSDDQRKLGHGVLVGPPFDQEILFRYDFDSKPPQTVLYVAREGHSLKELAQSESQ